MTDPIDSQEYSSEFSSRPARSTGIGNSYVLLFGLVMLIGLLFLAWLGTPPASVAIGQPMPKLDLQPLVNVSAPIALEDVAGKLTVIHFWGTWCPPCRLEFPAFVQLAEEFADNDSVAVISVSCSGGPEFDIPDLRNKTLEFLAQHQSNMPTYADSAAMTRNQLALLLPHGSLSYPTTLLINREGVIIEAMEGYLAGEMEELAEKIKALL